MTYETILREIRACKVVLTAGRNRSVRGILEVQNQAQQRRFATVARPKDGNEVPQLRAERDTTSTWS